MHDYYILEKSWKRQAATICQTQILCLIKHEKQQVLKIARFQT